MFYKLTKLWRLVRNGEYAKLRNALRLRLNRLMPGGHDLRAEVERHNREVNRVLREYFQTNNQYQDNTIKVALIVRGAEVMPKSSAFIRLIAPLTHPSIQNQISIKLYPENTAALKETPDVCIVQRTAFDSKSAARKFAKQLEADGAKLVLDTDDAFSLLERGHSQYQEHAKSVGALEYIAEQADELWLSTPQIAAYYQEGNKHRIIPNTLDERVWKHEKMGQQTAYAEDRPIRMVYMGTATHDSDLKMILPALDEIARLHPNAFHLTLIGVTDATFERPWIERLTQPEFGTMYPNFIQWFLRQGPFDVGLSPLIDDEFNRSKSDIKCLDYLAAGIVPVVSDIVPYQGEDIRPYVTRVVNTQKAWIEALTGIVVAPESFRKQTHITVQQAQEYIWQQRSSHIAAATMLERMHQLLTR